MDLRTWRQKQGLTLLELADRLGVQGSSVASKATTVSRIERGLHAVDALVAEKIVNVTNGAVSVFDLHTTRKEWMLANTKALEPADTTSAEAGA